MNCLKSVTAVALLTASALLLISALFSCPLYGQNAVTYWAEIVQPALNNTPPPLPAIQNVRRAMVHIAVYDAVVAIEGGYQPFAAEISAPAGSDVGAAVATAAYLTARAIVAESQVSVLDAAYNSYMTAIPDSPAKTDGTSVGAQAAAAVLALRANDGMSNVVLYFCSSDPPPPGEFEPDRGCPDPQSPDQRQPLGVNVGQIQPFTLTSPDQFQPDGPNPLTSIAYTEDFIETRDYGRCDSTVRTAEQTDIAYFWQIVNLNQGLIDLAKRGLDVGQAARFFAIVYTAAADANIAGFEAKYFYRSWRPRTAIPLADIDGNPDTYADPTWTPLISVNHPEYPSAHSFSTTAITDSIARFFVTNKVTWELTVSPTVILDCQTATPVKLLQRTRTYYDLNALMREIYDARVWAGLHWRHSMMHGAQIGRKVAKYVSDNFFRPLP